MPASALRLRTIRVWVLPDLTPAVRSARAMSRWFSLLLQVYFLRLRWVRRSALTFFCLRAGFTVF